MNKRLLAISDIHGCYDKLIEILNKVNYDPKKDQLILCGDYADRGDQNLQTLLFVNELIDGGAIGLLGNHDDMFRELLNRNLLHRAFAFQEYIDLGVNKTVKEFYSATDEQKLIVSKLLNVKLLPYYEYGKWIFVHGGVNASVSLEENSLENLIWSRQEFYGNKAYDDRIVVFGHTPTYFLQGNDKVWRDPQYKDKIGIDCGCVYKDGKLCCLDLTNDIEYYV